VIQQLEEWNRHWRLAGDRVVCRRCLAEQFADSRTNPFGHSPGCPRVNGSRAPWDDLESALRSINAVL
jgi:hypothetical protein